ncbi:Outer membrane lipoprotein-sorting protein domain-containing protein [Candidatus Magnetomoraceae bacterium gMMP-13]
MKVKIFILTVFFGISTGIIFAQEQAELTVDEIVRKANHAALYQGHDLKGKITMVITDKQARTRRREFNTLRKNDSENNKDQKYFVYFNSPADVRKMVFMVHKHADLNKDDDRWLYMPSLDLVKRIAASDKRTSFVGSDFVYEDISGRSPLEDSHELIRTTNEYYIIRNTPKNPEGVEFEYYVVYINKKTFIPMEMKYFKKGNRLYRVIKSKKIESIEAQEDDKRMSFFTVTESVAKDLENGSKTEMSFSKIRYNIGLDDKIFTERYLRRPPRDAMR